MFALQHVVAGIFTMLLTGCATTSVQPLPQLPPTHPASPDAPQAVIRRQNATLSDDEATRKTSELLGGTRKVDSSMPDMPGMDH